jgi:hypothetical protein
MKFFNTLTELIQQADQILCEILLSYQDTICWSSYDTSLTYWSNFLNKLSDGYNIVLLLYIALSRLWSAIYHGYQCCGGTCCLDCSSPRWYMSIESYGGLLLTEENLRTQRRTCPSATLSTTNYIWTDSGSNPGTQSMIRTEMYLVSEVMWA